MNEWIFTVVQTGLWSYLLPSSWNYSPVLSGLTFMLFWTQSNIIYVAQSSLELEILLPQFLELLGIAGFYHHIGWWFLWKIIITTTITKLNCLLKSTSVPLLPFFFSIIAYLEDYCQSKIMKVHSPIFLPPASKGFIFLALKSLILLSTILNSTFCLLCGLAWFICSFSD